MRALPTALLLTLAACAACTAPAEPGDEAFGAPSTTGIWAGNVVAESVAGGVRLGNNTTRPVGYFVIEAGTAAVALWAPCTRPTGCPTLAPGERRVVPTAEVAGASAARRDVIVYWWHLVAGRDGALRPDSVRAVSGRIGG